MHVGDALNKEKGKSETKVEFDSTQCDMPVSKIKGIMELCAEDPLEFVKWEQEAHKDLIKDQNDSEGELA